MPDQPLPSFYFYAFVVFTLVVVGGIAMMAELYKGSSVLAGSEKFQEFNSSFNRLQDVQKETDRMKGVVSDPGEQDFNLFGVLGGLINGVWGGVKALWTSWDFTTDAMEGLSTIWGVPSWIPSLLIGLVVAMIFFAVIGLLFQKEM